jgi:hypothetical protein
MLVTTAFEKMFGPRRLDLVLFAEELHQECEDLSIAMPMPPQRRQTPEMLGIRRNRNMS